MSDSLVNVSQLIQSPLVDRTNSVGRINDDAFARVSGSQQFDTTSVQQPDITTPPLQDEFFNFVQEQQDFQDNLDADLFQEDVLRQQ